MRRKKSMVADQVPPRWWHQGRERAPELGGLQHQLGPAIGQRALELVGQPAVGQGPNAFQRDRSAGTVGGQASEPCAIVGVPSASSPRCIAKYEAQFGKIDLSG